MNITINSNRINLFKNATRKINNSNNKENGKTNKNNKNSAVTSNQNDTQSELIKNLLQQKDQLNEQKKKLLDRKMDQKEKKYEIDEIDKKIKDIEAQIQQIKIQEKQEEIEKKQDKILKEKAKQEQNNTDVDETNDDIIVSASLTELIKYNSSQKTMHLLKDSKNRQLVEAEYIKPNSNPNSYNNKRLSQINASIASIDITVHKNIGDLNKSAERIRQKIELSLTQTKNKENEKLDEKQIHQENKTINQDSTDTSQTDLLNN
ncbi:FlxA-like family protein [uncultured Clostridium sp.]|uniref:FlxA-like family protein n=1 Tax=uncultured Clostridium sp. TaxID=59620 RepID=UPI0028E6F301|nr:FlxA-like family protein [uncultured Clostridium sp.]